MLFTTYTDVNAPQHFYNIEHEFKQIKQNFTCHKYCITVAELHNTLHNSTLLYNTLQAFAQVYTTLHIFTKSHTTLYNTLQNLQHSQLYKTLQHFIQLYTTAHISTIHYHTLPYSTRFHKTLQYSSRLYNRNFTNLYQESYKQTIQLHLTFYNTLQKTNLATPNKTLHNYTQHFTTLYTFVCKIVHNSTKLYTCFTNLYTTIQDYTKYYITSQYYTNFEK